MMGRLFRCGRSMRGGKILVGQIELTIRLDGHGGIGWNN